MTSLPNSIRTAMAAEGGAAAGDEFLWLEELQGKKALQWVQQENQRTVARFGRGEDFQRIEREVLDILNKDTQIPWVSKRGEYYYNFWQDQANPRGLLRRTTLDEYRKAKPARDGAGYRCVGQGGRQGLGLSGLATAGAGIPLLPDAAVAGRR